MRRGKEETGLEGKEERENDKKRGKEEWLKGEEKGMRIGGENKL